MTTAVPARRFTPDMLAGLDEPVRRYFTHAIRDGAPLPNGVRTGRPVCRPMRTHRCSSSGHACSANARYTAAAASTASRSREKAIRKASP
jgi:hypothetical protein